MKKVALLFLVLAMAGSANAQVPFLKKIKIGFHPGYVAPSGGGGGFGYAIEPGFVITDKLAANFRWEGTIFTRDFDEPTGATVDVGIGGIGSYTLNGVYYLMDGKFKPFVGLGFGMYNPANVEITVSTAGAGSASTTSDLELDPVFGFYPRVGFNLGHMNFIIEYNIVGDSESEQTTTTVDPITGTSTTSTRTSTFENSYLMVKLGFTLFGGGH